MNLRAAAKGKPCTLNFVGVCNPDPETTVLCHIRGLGFGEGTQIKPDDRAGVNGCADCHGILDRVRTGWENYEGDRFWYIARALIRTRIAQETE